MDNFDFGEQVCVAMRYVRPSNLKQGADEHVSGCRLIEKLVAPWSFEPIYNGVKTFELMHDECNVQAGDRIVLKEWEDWHYTGRELTVDVVYVLRDALESGLESGYCIIGFKKI